MAARKTPPRGMTYVRLTETNRSVKGHRYQQAHLTLPLDLARIVGTDKLFRPELTDEGILFRYVPVPEDFVPDDLPAWIMNGDGGELDG